MRKILLTALLFISSFSFSQDSVKKPIWIDTSATKKILDNTQHFIDSMKSAAEFKEVAQGLNNLAIYQKEQQAKQKKQAMLYIGLGIFFLIVLIVGLRRRTKSKQ